VGFPTLRLIRASIADWHIGQLQPGEFIQLDIDMPTIPKNISAKKSSASQPFNPHKRPIKQRQNKVQRPRVRKRPDKP
jgi:hypothetical protein